MTIEIRRRRNQKVNKIDNAEVEVEAYSKKKKKTLEKPKISNQSPDFKQQKWIEFNRGLYCPNCNYIVNRLKHQIDKKNYLGRINFF